MPAIVSREECEAAGAAVAARHRPHPARLPEADDPYLLRGLLTCGHCGGALACVTRGRKQ